MRAVNLVREGILEMVEVAPPSMTASDQVLVKTRAVGVCGSEVHAYQGTHPYRKAPVILGHEVAGEVVATGEDVPHIKPGDRVYVDPQWTCGTCGYCQQGMPNLCPEKRVLGTEVWPGGFGEYFIAPATSVFTLPTSLSYVQGCLIEPLTVALHVVARSGLQNGQSAAVLGTGSIGSLVVGVLKARGVRTICAADIRQHCLDAAGLLGATHQFLLPLGDYVSKIIELTGGQGVDAVFVTADDAKLVNDAIRMSRRLATIVLVALITEAPLQLQAFDVLSKEISIVGSLMANHRDVDQALALVASGDIDVRAILTHTLPIEQAQKGMDLARTKADGAIKVVMTWE